MHQEYIWISSELKLKTEMQKSSFFPWRKGQDFTVSGVLLSHDPGIIVKKIHVSRNIADGAWCLLHIPERLNQFEWDALHLMQHRTKPSMDFPSTPNHRLKFFYAWTFAHGVADFLVTIKKFSCRWWWRQLSWWEVSRPLLISLLNWEGKARLGGEGCCLAIDPVVAVA